MSQIWLLRQRTLGLANEAAAGQRYVCGRGATLVSSLMNIGLIDELRLLVNPIILGGGKVLFKDVKGRYTLNLAGAKPLKSGKVGLIYRVQH